MSYYPNPRAPSERVFAWLPKKTALVLGGLVVLLLAIWLINPFRTVREGNVGVLVEFGRAKDAGLAPGLHLINPFTERVVPMSVQVTTHDFREIDAASKELQSVKLTGKMTFQLDRAKVVELYRTVGPDYADRLMDPAFQDFMKEVVPQYEVRQILTKRDEIRAKAKERMTDNMAQYGIAVQDIYIANISFDPAFQKSIEETQKAAQDALTQAQIAAQEKEKANQKFEQADGERRAAVAKAQGEAESIRVKGQADAERNAAIDASLTPALIEYTKVQRWQGNVPQVEGGSGTIIDLRSAAVSEKK